MKPNPHRSHALVRAARLRWRVRPLVLAIYASLYGAPHLPAWAGGNVLPTSMAVVSGQASLSQNGAALNIRTSDKAVLNWQSFSIGAPNSVVFQQPSASSQVLNRVLGQDPSNILGTLQSNGKVWLINPNGVLFGAGARIDVGGLVASTLNIDTDDFINGRLLLKQNGLSAGTVVNQGQITTPYGGQVLLIGSSVQNTGTISAPGGQAALLAAGQVELVDTGTPFMSVKVPVLAGQVQQAGSVSAGRIDVYGAVVNQEGALTASVMEQNAQGQIVLRASGDVTLAAGSVTQASGGTVNIRSDAGTVAVNGSVTASAASGDGGQVRVDGAVVDVGSTGQVRADAGDVGQGGQVVLMSENLTRVSGALSARGGAQGGDGGLIETSTHQQLDIQSVPDASAPAGKAGTWLVDPYDITIVAGAGATNINSSTPFAATGNTAQLGADLITSALNAGTSVSVSTGGVGTGTQNGDITVASAINATTPAGATLSLNAWRNINVNSAISAAAGGGALNVALNANQGAGGGTATISSTGSISLNGGTLTLGANTNLTSGTLKDLTATNTGLKLITASGTSTLNNVTLDTDLSISNATINVPNTLTVNAGRTITMGGTAGSLNYLNFTGSGTTPLLTGGGTVSFASGSSTLAPSVVGSTLTIDSGITVKAAGGSGTVGGSYGLVNKALLQSTSGSGTLSVTGTNWVNQGVIQANGGNVYFYGSVNSADLGTWQQLSGTVTLAGTLNNTGVTYDLGGGSNAGNLNLNGTIVGGTITSSTAAKLVPVNTSTLNNVTLDTDLGITNATINVPNTLTVNTGRTVTMAGGTLTFTGSGTTPLLTGGGAVSFASGSSTLASSVAGSTLTIDSGITVKAAGGSGTVGGSYGLVNKGLLQSTSGSGTLSVTGTNWVNQGSVQASAGTVSLIGLTSNDGLLEMSSGATIRTNNANLTNSSTGVIRGAGTFDLGYTASGVPLVYTLGTLTNNGTIDPGVGANGVGTLTVKGNLVMGSTGKLHIDLAGTGTAQYDQLGVVGITSPAVKTAIATLGGTLEVSETGGYVAGGYFVNKGDAFANLLTVNGGTTGLSGSFASNTIATPTPGDVAFTFASSGAPGITNTTASTTRWATDSSGNWSTAANWSRGVPTANKDAVIARAANPVITVDSAIVTPSSLVLDEDLIVASGGALTLPAGMSSYAQTLTLAGGTLTNPNALTMTGALALGAGTVNGAGSLTLSAGASATKTTSGTVTVNQALNNQGTVSVSGGQLNLAAGGSHSGTFNAAAGSTLDFSGGTHQFADGSVLSGSGSYAHSGGTAQLTGTGAGLTVASGTSVDLSAFTFTGAGVLTNQGTVSGNAASFGGTLVNQGTADFNNGATLGGGFVNSGVLNINSGNLTAQGAASELAGGTINLGTGASLTKDGGVLNWSGGTFGGSGTLAFVNGGLIGFTGNGNRVLNNPNLTFAFTDLNLPNGSLTLQSGALTFNTTASGSTLIPTGTTLAMYGGTMTNNGPMNVSGLLGLYGGTLAGSGALNLTGGTIDMPASSTLNWTATGPMSNSGTLNLANRTITNAVTNTGTINSTGGLTFTQLFTNQGTFNQTSGSSTFSAGLTQTIGQVVLGSGGTAGSISVGGAGLVLNGGNLSGTGTVSGTTTLNAGSTMAMTGTSTVAAGSTLNVAGGTLNATTLSVSGTLNETAGALNAGATTVTSGGSLALTGGTAAFSSTLDVQAGGTLTSALPGTTTVTGATTNAGTLTVNAGTLNLAGGYSQTAGSTTLNAGGTLTGATTVGTGSTFSLAGGTLNATTLNVSGTLNETAGTLNAGATTVASGGSLALSGGTAAFSSTLAVQTGGSLTSALPGTTTVTGATTNAGTLTVNAGTLNLAGGYNQTAGSTTLNAGGTLTGATTVGAGSTFNLAGGILNATTLNVSGTFNETAGTLNAGATTVANGGAMNLSGGAAAFSSTMDVLAGGALTYALPGATSVAGASSNAGTMQINSNTLTLSGGYTQTAGSLLLGTSVAAPANIAVGAGGMLVNGGTLGGSGVITGNVSMGAATLAPGYSPGSLTISGNLTLGATSTTTIELGGTTSGSGFDVINVGGTVTLGGTLNVNQFGGFVPVAGNTFNYLTFGGSAGNFATVNYNAPVNAWGLTNTQLAGAWQLAMTGVVATTTTTVVPATATVASTAANSTLWPGFTLTGSGAPAAGTSGAAATSTSANQSPVGYTGVSTAILDFTPATGLPGALVQPGAATASVGGAGTPGASAAGSAAVGGSAAQAGAAALPPQLSTADAGGVASITTLPGYRYMVSDLSNLYFRVLPLVDMEVQDLDAVLQSRRAYKKSLFAAAIKQLEGDPSLPDLPDCTSASEGSSGKCVFNSDRLGDKTANTTRKPTRTVRKAAVATVPQIAHKYAVVIGQNQYDDKRIPQLIGAVPDALAVAQLLSDQMGYEVVLLQNADKKEIFQALNAIAAESKPDDSLLVYYAGHGETVDNTGLGYWIPRDASADHPRSWISNSDINRLLARSQSKQIAVVADSCYSGKFVQDPNAVSTRLAGSIEEILQRRAVTVMSSGGDEPVADTGKNGHSVFSWSLMEKIRQVSGWASGASIFDTIKVAVESELPQTPQYGAAPAAGHEPGADFVFERRSRSEAVQ